MQTSAPSIAGIVVGTGQVGVEAFDGRRLRDIEPLALRDTVGNVEQHDVAQVLQADR
jgi:hypothetical protein